MDRPQPRSPGLRDYAEALIAWDLAIALVLCALAWWLTATSGVEATAKGFVGVVAAIVSGGGTLKAFEFRDTFFKAITNERKVRELIVAADAYESAKVVGRVVVVAGLVAFLASVGLAILSFVGESLPSWSVGLIAGVTGYSTLSLWSLRGMVSDVEEMRADLERQIDWARDELGT